MVLDNQGSIITCYTYQQLTTPRYSKQVTVNSLDQS